MALLGFSKKKLRMCSIHESNSDKYRLFTFSLAFNSLLSFH